MKIFCIGRNYVDHIQELNNELPEHMVMFMKPSTALHFNNDPWYIPTFSNDIHYECEIVLKICKNGKYIQPAFADSYFEEISLGIDFTARDIQTKQKEKGLPWEIAKAFDHSAVVGHFMSKSNFDMNQIHFEMLQNERVVQKGNSAMMIYSFQTIICELSKYFTLQKGDLIYTGTPAGVGRVASDDILKGILASQEVFSLQIK